MVDINKIQSSIFKRTQIQEKVRTCVETQCGPLKNKALARLYSSDPDQLEAGSLDWLAVSLPSIQNLAAVEASNLCLKECRLPLDIST